MKIKTSSFLQSSFGKYIIQRWLLFNPPTLKGLIRDFLPESTFLENCSMFLKRKTLRFKQGYLYILAIPPPWGGGKNLVKKLKTGKNLKEDLK